MNFTFLLVFSVCMTLGVLQDNFKFQNLAHEIEENLFLGEEYDAGIIPLSDEEKNDEMFFWLFHPRDRNQTAPLVIWFQGALFHSINRNRRSRHRIVIWTFYSSWSFQYD